MRFNWTDGVCLGCLLVTSVLWVGMKVSKNIQLLQATETVEEDPLVIADTLFTDYDYSGYIDSYMFVDLGLPSGLKWAVCDVGTNIPGHNGFCFKWSMTKPDTSYSDEFPQDNYEILYLEPENDAATKNMGEHWRTPSMKEVEELIKSCNWRFYDDYRVIGTSRYNQNKIALVSTTITNEMYPDIRYWTCTGVDPDYQNWTAYCLSVESPTTAPSCSFKFEEEDKTHGHKVRAVSD